MGSVDKMLAYARSQWHRVGYSMAYPQRLGDTYLDCSSFVYKSLIAGGFLPKDWPIGNTESLYRLKGTVLDEIYSYDYIRPGDIFIRGIQGQYQGANGHTGIFTRKGEIIHCNAYNNTVTINNESSYIYYYLRLRPSASERYFRPRDKEKDQRKFSRARVLVATNVRTYPSTKARIVACYYPGQELYFDQIIRANGYSWLSYIGRASGERRYLAFRDDRGRQRMDLY